MTGENAMAVQENGQPNDPEKNDRENSNSSSLSDGEGAKKPEGQTGRNSFVPDCGRQEADIIYCRPLDKQIDLVERMVRVEEAIVHIQELIKEQMRLMDKRFEQVDKRFEQVDKRFEQVDKRFEAMQHQMDKRFEQVDKRFTQLQWLIGLSFGGVSVLMGLLNYL